MAEKARAQETLLSLRDTIARLEGRQDGWVAPTGQGAPRPVDAVAPETPRLKRRSKAGRLLFGIPAVDGPLEGGVPLDAMLEIRSGALRDAGASTGLALALCVRLLARQQPEAFASSARPGSILFVGEYHAGRDAGLPHAAGLADFGLPPSAMLYARPRKLDEALFIAEAGLASRAFSAVLLEIHGNPSRFGLTESRRLSLRARDHAVPLFLLRQAGEEEASSALFRLSAKPAPAAARSLPGGPSLGGSLGHPAFTLTLEKSRLPGFSDLRLEWNPHDRQFLAASDARSAESRFPAHSGARLPLSADRQDRPAEMGTVLAFDRAS